MDRCGSSPLYRVRASACNRGRSSRSGIPAAPSCVRGVLRRTIRSATTPVVGYRAEFCLISRGSGARSAVVTVPWDDKGMHWRYEVCEPRQFVR